MSIESGSTVYVDDFGDGLDPVKRWQVLSQGDFAADDGHVSVSSRGVTIAPPGRNVKTGEPAFTKALGGFVGHLKWLATTRQAFETDAGELRFNFRGAGAMCYGMADHPYGDAVSDVHLDMRLGSATFNVIDFELGLVFDFWVCNGAIYPIYERIRPPDAPIHYESFTQTTTPVRRQSGDRHALSIAVDAAKGSARWYVDGAMIAQVDRLGPSARDWIKVLDHGGEREEIAPRHLNAGLGLMTLLDASLPPGHDGLVDLGVEHGPPKRFRGGPLLFGQGAELSVERLTVERG